MLKEKRATIQDVIDYLDENVVIDGDHITQMLREIEEDQGHGLPESVPGPVVLTKDQAEYVERVTSLFPNNKQYAFWKAYKEWFSIEEYDPAKHDMPFNLDHEDDGELFRRAIEYGYDVIDEVVEDVSEEDLYKIEIGNGVLWKSPIGLHVHPEAFFTPDDEWKFLFTADELDELGIDLDLAVKVNEEGIRVE